MGNHLLSNISYPILGLLFAKVVRMKELFELEKKKEDQVINKGVRGPPGRDHVHKGVALDYDLFYTMGLTLTMIGVMSACYHVCPTTINLQFDTTYMHLLAIRMEKRADTSVLFFLIAVLIFWLYTCKQTVLFCTELLTLYY